MLTALNPPVDVICATACQAEAERLLLAAALADAGNQRFVLISETCIPLYPAPVVWAQLLGEPLARMHACRNDSDAGDAGRRQAFRCAECLHAYPGVPSATPSGLLLTGVVGNPMVWYVGGE